ncbi:C40 family peptidase [Bacillus sp. 31A1R]|uniref:C40 family peptidase n=1 Tax=Robertmurraya mangrovi TaxID=3098077 RepID=A0ABU5IXR4_9BACI|nr:C40 family peptidase [Bacillus sp. 31A1R]MDZ5471895.1 C40 family peptidase [Bacillus sp. 31A1R]
MKKVLLASILSISLLFSGLIGTNEVEASSSGANAASIGKKYIGTPYKYGGMSPNGFDCSGFVGYVFKKAGEPIPRSSREIYKKGKNVAKKSLKKGDLLFFNTSGKGVSHVAIYVGKGQFIHSANKGVKIDSLSSTYWKTRYIGAKRI